MRAPPALCPGDLVDVIAPSGPFERTLAWRGLGWLAERYRVRYRRDLFAVQGYLAGDDERRAQELIDALESSESRAVVAVRGGYGASRIVHRVNWKRFAQHPKWIVGFSDITALHVEATAAGVMSLHAPMLATLGRAHAPTRQQWLQALEVPQRPKRWSGLKTWVPGHAQGPLVGGNLTVLHACAAAGRLHLPPGAILFLEDIGERPYRIDRVMSTLVLGGHLKAVAGVVLGDFTDCYPGTDRVTVWKALESVLLGLGVPVASGLPVGHSALNDPLHFGALTRLHAQPGQASLEQNLLVAAAETPTELQAATAGSERLIRSASGILQSCNTKA